MTMERISPISMGSSSKYGIPEVNFCNQNNIEYYNNNLYMGCKFEEEILDYTYLPNIKLYTVRQLVDTNRYCILIENGMNFIWTKHHVSNIFNE